jgi:hypothetical protein
MRRFLFASEFGRFAALVPVLFFDGPRSWASAKSGTGTVRDAVFKFMTAVARSQSRFETVNPMPVAGTSLSRITESPATKLGYLYQDRLADKLNNEQFGVGGQSQYLAKLLEGLLGAPSLQLDKSQAIEMIREHTIELPTALFGTSTRPNERPIGLQEQPIEHRKLLSDFFKAHLKRNRGPDRGDVQRSDRSTLIGKRSASGLHRAA